MAQPITANVVETWDDGDFDDFDDIHLRTASTATSVVSQSHHRDSTSRMSIRSDSNQGDEHWDVLVDEHSPVKDVLSIAKSKGIPLPSNLPRSALEGGTIRKLGGKVVKKAIADDWSEDLEITNTPGQLKLAKFDDRDLSESLRQISAAFHISPQSPDMPKVSMESLKSPKSRLAPTPISLESFKDLNDDDDFADIPTIRVAKHRSPQKTMNFPPLKLSPAPEIDDFGDIEIPEDGQLRLSTKKLNLQTPAANDDLDMEWAEGSLGTRTAGLIKSGRSNRSSSVSAFSPSVSSAFTVESDDGLDGLILPSGPFNFVDKLKKREEQEKENSAPEPQMKQMSTTRNKTAAEEDWDNDLIIPNGRVFDGTRLTLHQNIKQKNVRATSPGKIKATTLNFTTTRSSNSNTRESRFSHGRQERQKPQLEPVSESGAPIQHYPRPTSRLGHHSHSSVSSIPAPTTTAPSTPSRRDLRHTGTFSQQRYQSGTTTTPAQLLRTKRSSTTLSNIYSPTRTAFPRPPSRQDGAGSRLRPRSPDRSESRMGTDRKSGIPFLPAGVSTAQSQHVSLKSTKTTRRNDSDGSGESMTAAQRSLSRLAGIRPQTPSKEKVGLSAADLAALAKKTVIKPFGRRRNWGDGSELETFDDLPTSATHEAKYTKNPTARGAPRSVRSKLGQTQPTVSSTSLVSQFSGAETPVPTTPVSPPKQQEQLLSVYSQVPRFARDTTASRNAREQRQVSTTIHNIRGEPLQPILSQRAQITISGKPSGSIRRKKASQQQKPQLIKPLGNDHQRPKEVNGMYYNPGEQRWEGNDHALASFDVPDFEPAPTSNLQPHSTTINHTSPTSSKTNIPLIMNIGGTAGVELVNGMVFDPRQMKWLKVAEGKGRDSISAGSIQLEEEEDVFAGLEDLKEETESASGFRSVSGADPFSVEEIDINITDPGDAINHEDAGNASNGSGDEAESVPLAEEYDVGPSFIQRQRQEEERWSRKVGRWVRPDDDDSEGANDWRWEIRKMVQSIEEPMVLEMEVGV